MSTQRKGRPRQGAAKKKDNSDTHIYNRQRQTTSPGGVSPVSRVAYIDTLGVWMAKVDKTIEDTLQGECDSLYIKRRRARFNSQLTCRLTLHQPSENAIRFLGRLALTHQLLVNEIHIALDFVVGTKADALAMHQFVTRHLHKRWPGKQQATEYLGTTYSGNRSWDTQILTSYATRPSKVNGQPCCHIEWRAKGARYTKLLGAFTPAQVMDLDLTEFWRRRLHMQRIDVEALGKACLGQSKAQKAPPVQWRRYGVNIFERAGQIVLRSIQTAAGPATLQEVKQWVRKQSWGARAGHIFRPVDSSEFLPTGRHYPMVRARS